MRDKLGVMAVAALLASVGVTNAKGPVVLGDVQLDKLTAGASPTDETAFLVATSAATLTRLVGISNWTLGFLNGVPLSALPPVTP